MDIRTARKRASDPSGWRFSHLVNLADAYCRLVRGQPDADPLVRLNDLRMANDLWNFVHKQFHEPAFTLLEDE